MIIVDGEIKKEHVYLIPKNKVDLYGDKKVYLNISENSETIWVFLKSVGK